VNFYPNGMETEKYTEEYFLSKVTWKGQDFAIFCRKNQTEK